MKRIIFLIAFIFQSFYLVLNAQQWKVYNTINSNIPGNSVYSISMDKADNKWISTNNGIAKYNDTSFATLSTYGSCFFKNSMAIDTSGDLWYVNNGTRITICKINGSCYNYSDTTITPAAPPIINTADTSIETYRATVLTVDKNNKIWIVGDDNYFNRQLLKFDGSSWTSYTNIPLGSFYRSIIIDNSENIWFGAAGRLLKFDGNLWESYIDSSLPNHILQIEIDDNNVKWLATNKGLVKFDGTSFTPYTTTNSDIPSNSVFSVAIDSQGSKWAATDYGLAKFDGVNWTIFTKSNSGLPSNVVRSLSFDANGKLWIGTQDEGLVVFDPSVVGVNEVERFSELLEIAPNPFSAQTIVSLRNAEDDITKYHLELFDIFGRMISDYKFESETLRLDRENLQSGIYFVQLKRAGDIIRSQKILIQD
jgi:ligand-binding sensor domain-containing protein